MIWWSLTNEGIPEQYLASIQDMYQDTQTRVKTRCDTTVYVDIDDDVMIVIINTFLTKKRLSWSGDLQRRDDDNVAKSVLNTLNDGCSTRGRIKLRWMDRFKDDQKQNKICPEWAGSKLSKTSTIPRNRRKCVRR